MKPLNYNNVKKPVMRIELADEKKTTLFILPPTKGEVAELANLKNAMEGNNDSMGTAFAMCAKLMSHNIANIKITAETLEKEWDLYDIQLFYQYYMQFMLEIKNAKN